MPNPRRIAVLNIVGLCDRHIGMAMPNIWSARDTGKQAFIDPAFPAVTCTAQSDYLTGTTADEHGVVGNGWYNREQSEVQFWKQSNHLVQGPKVWETLREKHEGFTCAKIFWWYNMYSSADWSVTPRPMYPADGRKEFDIYAHPASLRSDLTHDLGEFPFPGFWGPAAGVDTPKGSADCVSRWIAEAAKWIEKKHQPTLSLVYLPHLDYNLQRLGPDAEPLTKDLQEVDKIVGRLIDFYYSRGVELILLSEYGITKVNRAIHLNRLFREQGWLTVREELGLELLDAGASRVFAVADHQVAHVHVNDNSLAGEVTKLLEQTAGVQSVLDPEAQRERGIRHERAGDIIAVADEDAWFTYYYWNDDARAPDFARTVDIHRKPGYDPVELHFDMETRGVPLDASLVAGSHGAPVMSDAQRGIVLSSAADLLGDEPLQDIELARVVLGHFDIELPV